MIPPVTVFAEALRRPQESLRTLRGFTVAGSDSTSVTRTSLFAEAAIYMDGRRWLLCAPLRAESMQSAEIAAHAARMSCCRALSEYRILPDELIFRTSEGRECTCDLLLHDFPEGESLDAAVTHMDCNALEQALDYLREEFAAAGVVHNNLKPENIICGDDGRLHPVRYHYLRTTDDTARIEAEFDAVRDYIRTYAKSIFSPSAEFNPEPFAAEGEFDEVYPLCDMMRRVCRGGLFGFTDREGRVVIAPAYKYAEDFLEGRAIVESERGMGVIDRSGREIIEPRFDYIEYDDVRLLYEARSGCDTFTFDYSGIPVNV